MSFFKRTVKGVALFILGMNFVALMMHLNGSAVSGNPAWDFASTIVWLELWLVALALGAAIIYTALKLFFQAQEKNPQGEMKTAQLETANSLAWQNKNIKAQALDTSTSEKHDIESVESKHIKLVPLPAPVPQELSKEDIKKQVLRELTGRSEL
jgi:hypothetical protein